MGSWGRIFALGAAVATIAVFAGSGCASNGNAESFADGGGGNGDGTVTMDSHVGMDGQGGMDGPGGETGPTDGPSGDGSCSGGKTQCDAGCFNTMNDPNNCGACGHTCAMGLVCSMGQCGVSCTPPEVMCPALSDAGASGSDGGDGGTPNPPGSYCANVQNDPNNCGMCRNVCGANHTCSNGSCVLNCPASQKPCFAGNVCIPIGACCTTTDCTVMGETCASPGATCQCPGGQKACSANNQCIPSNTCCTTTDCSISGETCSGPGGTCNCPMGQKGCTASGTCIPTANCCTNMDCTVTGETCSTPGGTCACAMGFHACVVTNSCISNTTCCTSADCPVMNSLCPMAGGMCTCGIGAKICTVNNACIPNNSCCNNNDCLVTGQQCSGPGGNCNCPAMQYECNVPGPPPFDQCIPNTECCTNVQCVPPQQCSGPGGSCNCAAGSKFCSANGQCILIASCCTSADCTVMGETCSGPGGTCGCPVGEKACVNSCIPSSECCGNGDCLPPPANTTSTQCSNPAGGSCQILACTAGCFDDNGVYSDGCECCDDANGKSCAAATSLGTVNLLGSSNASGRLPGPGESDWFVVSFTGNTSTSYHPKAVLTADVGVVMEIVATCANGAISCGDGVGSGVTTWEVSYTNGSPTGQTWAPIPPVGNNGQIYIRVYRASGNPTCNSFTLAITN